MTPPPDAGRVEEIRPFLTDPTRPTPSAGILFHWCCDLLAVVDAMKAEAEAVRRFHSEDFEDYTVKNNGDQFETFVTLWTSPRHSGTQSFGTTHATYGAACQACIDRAAAMKGST